MYLWCFLEKVYVVFLKFLSLEKVMLFLVTHSPHMQNIPYVLGIMHHEMMLREGISIRKQTLKKLMMLNNDMF